MQVKRRFPRLGGTRTSGVLVALVMTALLVTALPAAASMPDGSASAATASSGQAISPSSIPAGAITPRQAANNIGRTKTVCGYVASTKYARSSNGRPTFLDLGRPYPNQYFTIVIWPEYRGLYSSPPERLFDGRTVCVRGPIERYGSRPQIEARNSRVWVP